MTEYIYIVKCPGCEDEHFDFFDQAKEHAFGCMSMKPCISQIEVNRNDFGECTDHCDLGTIWSWEDCMADDEPACSTFTKDCCRGTYDPDRDPEFTALDNTLDAVPDNFRKPSGLREAKHKIYVDGELKFEKESNNPVHEVDPKAFEYKRKGAKEVRIEYANGDSWIMDNNNTTKKPIPEGMTVEQLVEEMEENEDMVECKRCGNLYDKSDCKKEVKMGWLCDRCIRGIESHEGKVLKFIEPSELDEDVAAPFSNEPGLRASLKRIVGDHICGLSLTDENGNGITDVVTLPENFDDLQWDPAHRDTDKGGRVYTMLLAEGVPEDTYPSKRLQAALRKLGNFLLETFYKSQKRFMPEVAIDRSRSGKGKDLINVWLEITLDPFGDYRYAEEPYLESVSHSADYHWYDGDVELKYDDLLVEYGYGGIVDNDWYTPPEDRYWFEGEVSHEYMVPATDVAEFIYESCLEDDEVTEVAGGLEALEDDDAFNAFMEKNFDNLVSKYYTKILDYWREDAAEDYIAKHADEDDYGPDPDLEYEDRRASMNDSDDPWNAF